MKIPRPLALALMLVSGVIRAAPESSPTPETQPAPVLEIFEAKIKGSEMSQMGYDTQHPLMIVREVREARLAQDNKGVLLVLTEEDGKALADLTRDFDGRPLIFKSIGEVTRPINISGAVTNGRIGFKYPEAGPIAEELRRHFHLGEFAEKAP